ncbi:MAG: GIY-YIG nuclease family protein [Bacteroidota bacterium]
MGYFVYILYSANHHRTYTGQTDRVKVRIRKHNEGKVRSTKAYRPWLLINTEECATRGEAIERERWYKTPVGRKRIAEILLEWLSKQ